MQQEVLIIGAGWLGKDLAVKLAISGHSVIAVSRNAKTCQELESIAIKTLELHIDSKEKIDALPKSSIAIILLPPSSVRETSFSTYSELIHQICTKLPERGINYLIQVSSTGIYPAQTGYYTEESETGTGLRAAELKSAEKEVLSSGIKAAVIRAGGLCGTDRHPAIWNSQPSAMNASDAVNMIWKDDLIGIILHLISNLCEGIYNAVAPEHPDRREFYNYCYKQLNKPMPSFTTETESVKRIILSNKIVNSGFNFGFPDPCKFPVLY